jgi:hypothetical protein
MPRKRPVVTAMLRVLEGPAEIGHVAEEMPLGVL